MTRVLLIAAAAPSVLVLAAAVRRYFTYDRRTARTAYCDRACGDSMCGGERDY